MSQLIKPKDYKTLLDRRQTEHGIKMIKEFFQQNLSTELRLSRATAAIVRAQGLGHQRRPQRRGTSSIVPYQGHE